MLVVDTLRHGSGSRGLRAKSKASIRGHRTAQVSSGASSEAFLVSPGDQAGFWPHLPVSACSSLRPQWLCVTCWAPRACHILGKPQAHGVLATASRAGWGWDGAGAAAAATGSMAGAGVVLGDSCDLPCSPQFPLPSRYFLHSDCCIQVAK